MSLETHLEHFGSFTSQRTFAVAQEVQERLRETGSDVRERQ